MKEETKEFWVQTIALIAVGMIASWLFYAGLHDIIPALDFGTVILVVFGIRVLYAFLRMR